MLTKLLACALQFHPGPEQRQLRSEPDALRQACGFELFGALAVPATLIMITLPRIREVSVFGSNARAPGS